MNIQFICRGNIFRSFIAETYLRSLQLEGVTTNSSGSVAEQYKQANTSTHELVRKTLIERGLGKFMKSEYAEQLTQEKLDSANLNVFMYSIAYQEAVDSELIIPDNTLVWDISDFDDRKNQLTKDERIEFINEKLDLISNKVDELVKHRVVSA